MRAVGLVPAAALIAGAVGGIWIPELPRACLVLLPLAVIAAAMALRTGAGALVLASVVFGFSLAGIILAGAAKERALHPSVRAVLDQQFGGFDIHSLGPESPHEPILLRAVLLEDAARAPDAGALRVRARAVKLGDEWRDVDGGIALNVGGTPAAAAGAWRAGRTIEMPVVFHRPARFLNDGVADFERQLAFSGTTLFASTKSGLLIDIVARGSTFDEWAATLRAGVRNAVGRWVAPHDAIAAAIVTAVLIGDRTGLPDVVRLRLQAAGTYHVIAISGGNIAIVTALSLMLLACVLMRGPMAAVTAGIVLLAYSQAITAGPSVWRATAMATVYLAARAIDHRTTPWHALAIVAGAIVAVDPLQVRDAGFLLTCGATAALLAVAPLVGGIVRRSRVLGWCAAPLLASLATEVMLVPVAASVFSRLTAAGLVLNLIAVPLMAVVQIAGMVVCAFDAVPAVASAAGWIASTGAALLVDSASLVEVAPGLVRRVPPPAMVVIVTYYVGLAGTYLVRRRPARVLAAVIWIAAGTVIITGWSAPGRSDDAELRLTVFDVGQGEAILLQAPHGPAVLIDVAGTPFGSGSFDLGARVVTPAVWARGLRAVDTLLLTHGDPDHIGGARAVLEDLRPSQLWAGIHVPTHAPTQAVMQQAERRGTRAAFRRTGEVFPLGDAVVRVLHPSEPDWERRHVRNDDSVVIEVVFGDVAVLLTGDIGAEVEREILPRLTPARVRILKVAHHGSRTSTSQALLDHWRPHIALISAGRGNTFGHPAPEVLRRLATMGTGVYRTDRDGQITVRSDGRRVSVRTFVERDDR